MIQCMIERGQFPFHSCFPSSLPGPCKVDTTPLAVKEDPDSENMRKEVSLDASKDAELHTKSLTEPQATFTPSLVDREREMARKKEQERRRREAVSASIYRFVLVRTKMAENFLSLFRFLVLT